MDTWGYCSMCRRWFYPDRAASTDVPPSCPVCTHPASKVEDRSAVCEPIEDVH